MTLDEKDIEILHAIANAKNDSPDKISELTDIPTSTIHYRLQRLREEGIITDDLKTVDLDQVGLSMTIISEIWAEYGKGYHETVGRKLSRIDGVNQVYFLLGETDFVVVSNIASRPRLELLIEEFEAIDEIQRTSSQFVITTLKDEPRPLADYSENTLKEIALE